MIHIAPVSVLVFVAALIPTLSVAADTCAPGQRRLNNGEPCIPETLFNFLYCLSILGGGKVEIISKGDSSTTRVLEVNVSGKGSGVIFKGEGSGGSKQAEANRAVREVSERIDSSLAKRCQDLASSASPPTPPSAKSPRTSATDHSAPKVPANVETCAGRPGYPLGRWGVTIENATPAAYSTFVTFTGSSSGTWLPSSGKGSFETSVMLAPSKAVVLTLRQEPGTYKSENHLVVSADGCRMTGTFMDSEGRRGEAFYRWQGDKQYPASSGYRHRA